MESLKVLGKHSALEQHGYEKIKTPITIAVDQLKYIPLNDNLSFYYYTDKLGKKRYFWDFMYNEIVDTIDSWEPERLTKPDCYINSLGHIVTLDRIIDGDKPITFDFNRLRTQKPTLSELKNLGDRVIVVGDDGLVYAAYEYPFNKMLQRSEDGKLYFDSKRSGTIVYEASFVSIEEVGIMQCYNIFPRFK